MGASWCQKCHHSRPMFPQHLSFFHFFGVAKKPLSVPMPSKRFRGTFSAFQLLVAVMLVASTADRPTATLLTLLRGFLSRPYRKNCGGGLLTGCLCIFSCTCISPRCDENCTHHFLTVFHKLTKD